MIIESLLGITQKKNKSKRKKEKISDKNANLLQLALAASGLLEPLQLRFRIAFLVTTRQPIRHNGLLDPCGFRVLLENLGVLDIDFLLEHLKPFLKVAGLLPRFRKLLLE